MRSRSSDRVAEGGVRSDIEPNFENFLRYFGAVDALESRVGAGWASPYWRWPKRHAAHKSGAQISGWKGLVSLGRRRRSWVPVSYIHLTLPTIYSLLLSVVPVLL